MWKSPSTSQWKSNTITVVRISFAVAHWNPLGITLNGDRRPLGREERREREQAQPGHRRNGAVITASRAGARS